MPPAPEAEKMRLWCPNVCLFFGKTRCAPQKCKSFTISGSPGVLVNIHNTGPVINSEEAAANRWSLSDPMDVLVKMTSPSTVIDEEKVGLEWAVLTQLPWSPS